MNPPDPGDEADARDVEFCDLVEGGAQVDLDDAVVTEGGGVLVPATVKMKLNTFLRTNKHTCRIKAKLNEVVLDGNRLLGEAYAFANFHVGRLLEADLAVPVVDRNFYYRCLLAVCISNCRPDTLGEGISGSMALFDQLRSSGQTKVDATLYGQLLADLSISMATMASNHLWMNIESRVERFLCWRYPGLKKFHKTVVRAVVTSPRESVAKIFDADSAYKAAHAKARKLSTVETPPKPVRAVKMTPAREAKLKKAAATAAKVAKEAAQRDAAIAVADEMRLLMPLPGRKKFASKCHLTLRMYHWLLKQTEAGKAEHGTKIAEAALAGQDTPKPFQGRLFSILPLKSGFTTSYIPISSMFLLVLLRSIKLSDHAGDGRDLDFLRVWSKFFAVSLVETEKSRSFGCRILTDGYAVSALVSCKVSLDTGKGKSDLDLESMQNLLAASAAEGTTVRVAGVDPGFTDVVTVSFSDGSKPVSYSSSRYYETAKVKYSARRIRTMNEEKKATTDTLLAAGRGKTSDPAKMQEYVRAYLAHLKPLLSHRMTRQYRKLRFLRHIYKQIAVKEIVDMIVGRENNNTVTLVGFGNWSGGSKSPISRQHAGPIQLIKDKIGKRRNAEIKPVDEYKTSQLDNNTLQQLVNMRATSVVRKKDGSKVVRLNNKVHKVLHCKPSDNCKLPTCKETTWNRDVNASRNILNLFLKELNGQARPAAFCRPVKKERLVGMSPVVDLQVMNHDNVIPAAPLQGTT